jgi:hypothetical protein
MKAPEISRGQRMPVATFDTLKFANTLKSAGVPPEQAEAQAVAFAEVIQLNLKELVDKDDLSAAEKGLKQEIKEAEQRLNTKADNGLAEVKVQIAQLKGEVILLKWMMGAVLAALLGVGGLVVRVMFMIGR